MAEIWVNNPDTPEGKYLVVRRDGTVPEWGHFVLSYDDPATPTALNAYAHAAAELGMDAAYVKSLRDLAEDLGTRPRSDKSDPDAPKHREDVPAVVRLMRREADLRKLKLSDLGLRK